MKAVVWSKPACPYCDQAKALLKMKGIEYEEKIIGDGYLKEDQRFADIKAECETEVYALYMDVIREEKTWADYLFNKGPVIGLNANILKEFVDYTAVGALKDIGIKYTNPAPKVTPIPWFNKHSDTSKKQTALQENESTNYVIGVMSENIDYDALPAI